MPKVWIGGVEVYMDGDQLPEFSYSITDLGDPTKVRGARSTSFDIPATNEVRQALGGITLAEDTPTDAEFRIGDGGATLFNGVCTPVEWSDDAITVNAFSDNAGWTAEAKVTKLQDVDLGTSGGITAAYQRASWEDPEQADVYPLMDYGGFEDRASTYDVGIAKLRPALRIHRILTKFFNDRGFTVQATGRLARHWKGLILANTGRVQVSRTFLADNIASVQGTAGVTPTSRGLWPVNAPGALPVAVTVTDPGGNIAGNVYTAPYNMRLQVRLNGTVEHGGGGSLSVERYSVVAYKNITGYPMLGFFEYQAFGATHTQTFDDQVVWEGDLLAGEQVALGMYASGTLYSVFADATATFEPVNIEYQSGVTIDVSAAAPKMTVGDLVSGLCNVLRLVVRTDDSTNTVTFSYYNDFTRPEVEGIDWRDRLDHMTLRKVQPAIPKAWQFRWKDDRNDQLLRNFREANDRGYGDYDLSTGGVDKPFEVDVPFAATLMGMRFGNIPMPVLRKEGPYYQQDFYEWEPRLLIMDGLMDANWVHDGDTMTEAPRTYFVGFAPQDISLAYGPERSIGSPEVGVVEREWREFIRRTYAPYLTCKCRVYDDEFMGFSFGRPRLIHDGWHQTWCYVGEIKGKRFGDESFVEVDLIPV